jgi:hypothetical protein
MRGHRSCPTRGYGYFNATSIPIFAGSGRPTPRATFTGCSRRIAGASRATQQAHFFQDIAVPICAIQILAQRNAACLPFAFAKMAGGDQGNPQQNAHKRTAGVPRLLISLAPSAGRRRTSSKGRLPTFDTGRSRRTAHEDAVRNISRAELNLTCRISAAAEFESRNSLRNKLDCCAWLPGCVRP